MLVIVLRYWPPKYTLSAVSSISLIVSNASSQNVTLNIKECTHFLFIIIQRVKSGTGRWISMCQQIHLPFRFFPCHDDEREPGWRAPPSLSPSLWFCRSPSQRTPWKLNKLKGSLRCGGGIQVSTSSRFSSDLWEKMLSNFSYQGYHRQLLFWTDSLFSNLASSQQLV